MILFTQTKLGVDIIFVERSSISGNKER